MRLHGRFFFVVVAVVVVVVCALVCFDSEVSNASTDTASVSEVTEDDEEEAGEDEDEDEDEGEGEGGEEGDCAKITGNCGTPERAGEVVEDDLVSSVSGALFALEVCTAAMSACGKGTEPDSRKALEDTRRDDGEFGASVIISSEMVERAEFSSTTVDVLESVEFGGEHSTGVGVMPEIGNVTVVGVVLLADNFDAESNETGEAVALMLGS
jgi:hypothetical protein